MTVRERIAEAANTDVPREACGFVLDDGEVVHCTNVSYTPWFRFKVDPAEAAEWWLTGRVVGVWHSHPTGPAVPSEEDEEDTEPGIDHLIYSVEDEDLAVYLVEDGRFGLVRMESPE